MFKLGEGPSQLLGTIAIASSFSSREANDKVPLGAPCPCCKVESVLARLTWRTVPMLLVAALLAGERGTVAAAHHQMGLDETANFGLCHHVFSCVRWSALEGKPRLLVVVVRTFIALASVRQIENHSIATMLIVHRITQSGLSVVRRPYDHTLGI
jgi:hypothetical protein